VFFTVKAWNFGDQAVSLSGFVEDENGTVVKSVGGFIGRLPANTRNYTLTAFSLDVYGVGNHTYKLFLDNYDGKPNGAGEEHWSKVTVEVEPTNGTLKQVGFECDDLYLSTGLDREHHLLYRGTLTCEAILYNPTSRNLVGNITDVYTIKISPRTLDKNLVGEWVHTARINIGPHNYYIIVFQRNTKSINVYTLEHDLYGLTFTVELHYEFKGLFNKEFAGTASAEITQNSVQAAISGTIFIGGTVATAVGFFISAPALSIIGGISFIVGLYQTVG